jgi:hypothetical protein
MKRGVVKEVGELIVVGLMKRWVIKEVGELIVVG